MAADPTDHTFSTKFRIPRGLWDAYGRVTARLDTDRSADLLDYVRAMVEQHGDAQDRADLAAADQELAARRARKGGRPKKEPTL
ncbi:hypothetical protein [Streptomyces niveus]|uniref:hypothetical protein n=1 Tax=Streptomyces niveus TaxID=193462 RepID=UPI00084C3FE8|nr:hypothetical protein [Streptomyces niveus]